MGSTFFTRVKMTRRIKTTVKLKPYEPLLLGLCAHATLLFLIHKTKGVYVHTRHVRPCLHECRVSLAPGPSLLFSFPLGHRKQKN
jgi:hypothetical protein